MTGGAIREAFLGFFERRGHRRVRSSPLIPAGDPTLLFSNAGMNQFKDLFLGREARDYHRATTAQKCLRVSGKHNDFDQVGRTARHHTFFEMLGNFSFGDYFKEDAIAFAWELVIKELGLPPARLSVSVYREDEEAAGLWRRVAGLSDARIARLGEADNFWAMGDTGPCGPCSEIYYDQGSGVGCGRTSCDLTCGCDRYLEFWNLVFMQYERQADGAVRPLAAPSIDTGAGLERLAAVLQGVDSNYRTDLFLPLIEKAAGAAGREYGRDPGSDVSLQVLADHLRAVTFLVADGVVPSNEKRGYVLRRIIRRALTHGRNLGLEAPFLHSMTGDVVALMQDAYPELATLRGRIADVCRREEETFRSTLERGLEVAGVTFAQYQGSRLPASEVVRLWTTFGVTTEIQQALAPRHRVSFPSPEDVEAEMEKHREAARASWKGDDSPSLPAALVGLPKEPAWQRNEFVGYETLEAPDARVLALATEEGLVESLAEGQRGFVVLDRTPFYAEAGGQVGDTGRLRGADGSEAEVDDTQSPAPGLIVHFVTVLSGSLQGGEPVQAAVDHQARAATMRNHTATHLLHAALKRLLGPEVQQAGSYVGPDRLRFDFNYPGPVPSETLDRIEDDVNERILLNTPVSKVERRFDEAMEDGAIALFGEKYGDRVRVVTVPGYSKELCGGTHCAGTGDIGIVRIIGERGIAAGVRRIEALTGSAAMLRSREDARLVSGVSDLLKARRESVQEALVDVLAALKAQGRELERLRLKVAELEVRSSAGPSASPAFERIGDVRLVTRKVTGLDRPGLRNLADNLKREVGTGVVVLASESQEGKVSLLVAVTEDLAGRLDARDVMKDLAARLGGGGGGNALLAEAGGKDAGRIPEALAASASIVAQHLVSAPHRGAS